MNCYNARDLGGGCLLVAIKHNVGSRSSRHNIAIMLPAERRTSVDGQSAALAVVRFCARASTSTRTELHLRLTPPVLVAGHHQLSK